MIGPYFFASKAILFTFLFSLGLFTLSAQTGPGGVGNTAGTSALEMWVRGDNGVTQVAGNVSQWTDQSGYAHHLTQALLANQPTYSASVAVMNNMPCVLYNGASSQFFNPAFNGPSTNEITIFLAANGTSYQSLIRYQNNAGIYLVYPWEFGGGRTFITSSDGGTASGLASGIVNSVMNVGTARYKASTVNGFQTFLNGTIVGQRTSIAGPLPTQPFYSGRYNPGASEYPTATVGEMVVYYQAVNEAQRIIVENYLSAKYGSLLATNDVYTMDNVANGNYDYNVAGIGQASDGSQQTDSRGTGIVEVKNASALANSTFFMWGDDNGALTTQITDIPGVPSAIQARMVRVWRPSAFGGGVGTFDISFDLTGLGAVTASDLRLLIDANNNGLFADETAPTGIISGATLVAGNVYKFSGVTIGDGLRFTLATINSPNTPLPVELVNFTATPCHSNNQVCVEWTSASETNNNFYTVEHSADGNGFQSVCHVDGAGYSSAPLSYSCQDDSPYPGLSYYRLSQTDFNGQTHVFPPVPVDLLHSDDFSFSVFPNPSQGSFSLQIQDARQGQILQVSVCDLTGKEISVRNFILNGGESLLQIDSENPLPLGMYLLRVTSGNSSSTKKLIVH
jgi:hypothetical protein